MIVASLILAVAAVVIALLQLWRIERNRGDRALTKRQRESVIVTLKAGPTFAGVLSEFDARSLVLTNANAVEELGQVSVDGELLLRWSDVAFVQKP